MTATRKKALWGILVLPLVLLGAWLFQLYRGIDVEMGTVPLEPLRVVIADPLCRWPVCDDLKGEAGRDYAPLAAFLEARLGSPAEFIYTDDLGDTFQANRASIDLVIGKTSVVSFEAGAANETIRPIARLADRNGLTDVLGLFVVRESDPARTLSDLEDYRVLFGPVCEQERRSAAVAALAEAGVAAVPPLRTATTCGEAAAAVAGGSADVAIISSYALRLLEDSETIDEGALRVLGRTAPVPFITVFATARVSPALERKILDALWSVREHPQLLEALDSKAGFVDPNSEPLVETASPAPSLAVVGWTDWRGPGRAGLSPDVPTSLPARVKFLWKRGLTGPALSGVAATGTHVVVADKSASGDQDIWRCLDAETGRELWTIAYATPKEMEFTNAPRATPVIHEGFVYLLGAFGDLHCVSLYGSRIMWRRNIVAEFGAELPPWGMCSTPLIVDDALIVNPGAADASLAALGLYAGEVLWKTPGERAAYASLVFGTLGGVRQIVGYDAASLGGWDPDTGRRLWTLLPDKKGDYNVPTPVSVNGRLLVATENNGARLYDFDEDGRLQPAPVAQNHELAPDTSTPVVIDGLVFGCSRGLLCLDLDDGLRTLYATTDDGALNEHAAFLAGNGHVLAVTVKGELVLLKAARQGFTPVARLRVFEDTEVWSHPALVGDRLYLRSMKEICCVLLSGP